MARCIFDGLTPQQAIVMADWFGGEGEQNCEPWFDAQGVEPPRAVGVSHVNDDGDVTQQCR